jgi:hypothetical protein
LCGTALDQTPRIGISAFATVHSSLAITRAQMPLLWLRARGAAVNG